MKFARKWMTTALALLLLVPARFALAQLDQGTITGVVQDASGAVIGGASVTLTNVDEGLVLKAKSDGSGIYVFSPIKIGNYSISVSAPGFQTTTQTNLHLSLQQRLNVTVELKPGSATETVTVTTEEPLMQTQESSVGQTMDTQAINSVPLSGRNWVYIAQLAAGADPPEGSRGAGKGDFNANGQRAEENNFILDGIDNNANVVDFYNGASFVVNPPPDALAEMKVQTSDYSAEFGHSAGAVVNASIKSGTNSFHGSAWEYVRNTAFDIHDWNNEQLAVPDYHENQFGATLGGPVWKNKVFLFGDAQASRVHFAETTTETVPTSLERLGDFSEIGVDDGQNTDSYTGAAPVQLYYQTASAAPAAMPGNCLVARCSGKAGNVSGQGLTLNQRASTMLNLYPMPNTNNGKLTNNYVVERPVVDNTFQWDLRADFNITSKDTAYSRHSYWNEVGLHIPPLGDILDGGGFGDDGKQKVMGQSFMTSETHVFSQTVTNEARVGYTYLHTGFQHPNAANLGFAAAHGFGGIPSAPLNGGLPAVSVSGISGFGSPTWSTTDEHENVYQIIDNVTKIAGSHALKAGVSFESIRFSTLQPQQSRGSYTYNGEYTSDLNASNTGYGVADFLLDQQNSAGLSNEVTNGDARWDNAAYFEDDWRLNQKIALNLGLRWEHFQPYQDVGGYQASYNMTGPASLNTATGIGSGKGQYQIPSEAKSYAQSIFNQTAANCGTNANKCTFPEVTAADNISIVYTDDPHIVKSQKTNFAPRIGVAFSPDTKTTVRAGFGIFYGGLESIGYYPNLGENYPFQYGGSFPSGSCGETNCPTDGITIANGFATIVANGFASNVENLQMRGSDPTAKTPYTEDFNLSVERGIGNDIAATVSYVGDVSRHMQVFPDPNNPLALENHNNSTNPARPFPDFAGSQYTSYSGMSDYHSLQAKVEKRMSKGYNLLATYTWSHNLDDAPTPLGTTGDGGFRQSNLIPIRLDYSNSGFDTRQRFTFNALYQLPFGRGRTYLNQSKLADVIVGGWSANATFVAQTGNPFSVVPSNGFTTAAGAGSTYAIKTGDPFAAGGSGSNCATKTKTRTTWFNPCSFANPWDSSTVPTPTAPNPHYIPKNAADAAATGATTPVYVTSLASAVGYMGGKRDTVLGPGYERVNMSVFKDFKTIREQSLSLRVDAFNLLNTPSLADPSDNGSKPHIDLAGAAITGPKSLQSNAPDSRFFQLSLSYKF